MAEGQAALMALKFPLARSLAGRKVQALAHHKAHMMIRPARINAHSAGAVEEHASKLQNELSLNQFLDRSALARLHAALAPAP